MSRDVCLALTALEETWDSSKRIVLLGEWCRRWSNRAAWNQKNYAVIPFLWNSANDVERALVACGDVYGHALHGITELLNAVHGIAKTERYYHILLGNWLEYFIHQCYDKYLTLRLAADQLPHATCRVMRSEDRYVPVDIPDFLRRMAGDQYSLQIYSDILSAVPSIDLTSEITALEHPLGRPVLERKHPKFLVRDAGFQMLGILSRALHGERVVTVTWPYVGRKEAKALAWLSLRSGLRLSVNYMEHRFPPFAPVDALSRERARLASIPSEFGAVIAKLVPRHVPVLFWEGFRAAREFVARLRFSATTPIFTGTGLHQNSILKFHLAENYQTVPVLDQVHGGGYGMDAMHSAKEFEKSIATSFYGSRWVEREGGLFLPSAKFSRGRKRVLELRARIPSRQRTSIFFSANEFPRYVYRFQFHLNSSACPLKGVPAIVRFVQALPPALQDQILLRVYPKPREYDWDLASRVREQIPEIRVDDVDIPFEQQLASCRLYVTSQNGTTLLEALAADIPTVCYFDPSVYRFSAAALQQIEALATVGVVHPGPEAAAAFVASVYHDIDDWWNQNTVREARARFVDEYAATDDDWGAHWIREFRKHLAPAGIRAPG